MVTRILRGLGPRRGCLRAATPLTARAWYERGLQAEASGDRAAARAAYQQALHRDPCLADASCNLGRLLHEDGDLTGAERCYRVAAALSPDEATHRFNLGVALEDQGRYPEAIDCYREALARDARLADAHFNLARLYEAGASHDLEAARAAIRHWQSYRALGRSAVRPLARE
jgi:tetratricopeptide (TPR) repeat protein